VEAARRGGHSSRFDVSGPVLAHKAEFRRAAIFNSAVVGLGLAAVGFGAALVVTHPILSEQNFLIGGAIVGLSGALVVALYLRSVLLYVRVPRSLAISNEELVLDPQGHSTNRVFRWDDPRFRLTLVDRRGLGPTLPDGEPTSYFSMTLKGGPRVPLTEAAFEAVVGHAKAAGAEITRRTITTPKVPGTFELIFVRGTRQQR
jgi:hypothetical protein